MSLHGYQKMSAKPCKQDAEESLPVRSLSNRKPKPPNCLLIQDKTFYSLGLTRTTVHTWRERWRVAAPHLDLPEAEEPDAPPLAVRIEACLADAPRPGTPATFTPEQLTQLIALACEAPQDSGRPVTHWTPKELADELVQRDIVESISPRTIGRFLKRSRSQAPSDPVLAQS